MSGRDEFAMPESDDLDAILSAPLDSSRVAHADAVDARLGTAALISEPCKKCHGRKRFISYSGRDCGPCFTCKGTGRQTFKNDRATRDSNRAKLAERKANKAAASLE